MANVQTETGDILRYIHGKAKVQTETWDIQYYTVCKANVNSERPYFFSSYGLNSNKAKLRLETFVVILLYVTKAKVN